jgi:hypothetical protein
VVSRRCDVNGRQQRTLNERWKAVSVGDKNPKSKDKNKKQNDAQKKQDQAAHDKKQQPPPQTSKKK